MAIFPGELVLALMKPTNSPCFPRSVPALSSMIDKGSGCGLQAHSQRANIWNSFPARVDRECTRQTGSYNISPVPALAASDGQIMRAQLWVKVFMCLCDHRYVLFLPLLTLQMASGDVVGQWQRGSSVLGWAQVVVTTCASCLGNHFDLEYIYKNRSIS